MDRLTAERRSANMRQIKSKNMKPELLVRRLVHSMGFRFRLHRADLPGTPDLVFAGRKKVIFVHGCFWHQHPKCKHSHTPRSNSEYWLPKLSRNVARDAVAQERLQETGWKVLTIWECELKDIETIPSRIREFLDGAKPQVLYDLPSLGLYQPQ